VRQAIRGTDIEIGDAGIVMFLETCLALDERPLASRIFAHDAPRPQSRLGPSPDGLLGAMGYGAKGYKWGRDWREVAHTRIDGAQSVKPGIGQYEFPCYLCMSSVYGAAAVH
jgi:hypothetical protein